MAEMQNKFVVLTRAQAQAQGLHDVLFSEGVKSLVCPLLLLNFNDLKWPNTNELQAIVLTSSRSIEAMIHADVLDRYTQLPCFCVGGDTAQLARDSGFSGVHVGMGGAKGLSVLLGSSLKPDNGAVFYPCGADVAYALGAEMERNGYEVMERVVYDMKLVPDLPRVFLETLRDGNIGSITFYSARTATHFAALVKQSGIAQGVADIKALCISQSVLECVQHLNWDSTHVASRPDGQGMIELIKQHA